MPRPAFDATVQARYQTAMGAGLGDLYLALMEDLLWLHEKWDQFLKLYGHSEERLAILNKTACNFFALIEEVQWQDIVLHLARLTDPPQSVGKDNLTLCAIPGAVADAPLRARVDILLAMVKTRTSFARDWRNRQLAHTDRALALGQRARPLAAVSRQQITDALGAMRELLNALELKYRDGTMAYEVAVKWDADSLVRRLDEREA